MRTNSPGGVKQLSTLSFQAAALRGAVARQ